MTALTDLREIEGDRVVVFNYYNDRERVVRDLDMVVIVTPSTPNDSLIDPLRAAGREVHAIGDCVAPRDIEDAVYEGHRAGRLIGSERAAVAIG